MSAGRAPPRPRSPAAQHAHNTARPQPGRSDAETEVREGLPEKSFRGAVKPKIQLTRTHSEPISLAVGATRQVRSGEPSGNPWYTAPSERGRRIVARSKLGAAPDGGITPSLCGTSRLMVSL